jgi:hypothetical protein
MSFDHIFLPYIGGTKNEDDREMEWEMEGGQRKEANGWKEWFKKIKGTRSNFKGLEVIY